MFFKMIFAVKLERVFFYDKPKHISEVEGRSERFV